ncbi:MAG TPA: 3-isopropylmalate dehydratase small subunit, partial [Candidatus Angelobacter sp.]
IAQLAARDAAGLYRLKVDLEQCQVSWNGGFQARFEIDPFSRTCLLEGLDEIGTTLKHEAEIAAYEQKRRNFSSLQ